jgi:histone H3/H4
MHDYIGDAKRIIEDIENSKKPEDKSPGRMSVRTSNIHRSILPTWYTRVRKHVRTGALRRIMRRTGIKRQTKTSYIMARAMLMEFLHNTIEASVTLAEYRRRKTVTLRDVKKALKTKYGMSVYGV